MMKRLTFGATIIAASFMLGACGGDSSPTGVTTLENDDYALVMFGAAGDALQSTLGEQTGHPFDGRTGAPPFPDSIALSADQIAAIQALRDAFRTANQPRLDSLRAIFQDARAAHEAGQPRDSIRAILMQARPIVLELWTAVMALHQAILAEFTDAQRAWLLAHRRPPPTWFPRR